ncbi:MAG: KAP family NTPase, partial [Acidobacteriota bacterium]|nr:KAP family NTPase [Acidobacteriota bacterium]
MKNIEAQGQIVSQQFSHPTEDGAKPAPSLEVGHATRVCRTNLIKDIPATSDAFSDQKEKIVGPHQTVADVIASMIRDPGEEGISIGLEGSWGSGKTTVIKLLCEALKDDEKDDPNICLIQFDAWAHEGDPLRRTFLETLIRRLEKKEWVSKPEWDEE